MPSKFDEYLKTGGFSEQDKQAAQVQEAKHTERNSAPTSVVTEPDKARPDAPQPAISEERKEGIESTQQNAPDAYDQQSSPSQTVNEEAKGQAVEAVQSAPKEPKKGVEADYPSSQSRGGEPAVENEAENEQEEEL
jgi:hypothetical protein